jgi:dolichol-phosphate mannosyltransferase
MDDLQCGGSFSAIRSRHLLSEQRLAPALTVVVPTFNESENVPVLVERVSLSLMNFDWELVFVDDNSPDATSAVAKRLGQRNARVRCIRRVGRRGLAGAFLEGALSSQAQFVAVMDGDLQHDESLLPEMLKLLVQQDADMVIGSRYTIGGDAGGLGATRRAISRIATQWARRLTHTAVEDPMSGFFMMRRQLLDEIAPALSNEGFKILFDILVTARGANLKIIELPYGFKTRESGSSKFDLRNAVDFAALLLSKLTRNVVPLRFFSFLLVGGSGVVVQLACLWQGLAAGLSFPLAAAIATLAAMTSNFLLNNLLTYRDQRVAGWRIIPALITFYAVCSIGALSNVGVSSWLYSQRPVWWLAGIAGSVVGAVWNYTGSSIFVWKRA